MSFNGKITIAELSRVINISRPSLYKYVNEYEMDNFTNIPIKIIELFDFIYSEKSYNKNDIIEYCVSKYMVTSCNSIIDEVKMLINTRPSFKEELRIFIDDFYKNNSK